MVTVQLAPWASDAGQLLVCWKSPWMEIAESVSGPTPPSVICKVCGALVVPTF